MRQQKFKSTKQFFWKFNQLKKAVVIKPCLQPNGEEIREQNKLELAVSKRVRWELGPEGWAKWMECGYKDFYTLGRAYGIIRHDGSRRI